MITSNVNRVIYKGNGVATEFAYPFKIFDRTDIKVLLVDKDGERSILTSDYYVDMETMKVYYPGYAPGAEEPETDRPDILQEGETLVIYREVPITQMDRLPDNYPFNVIEKMDDKSCVIDQQLADKLTRAITMSEETALTFDGTMPPIQPGKTLRVKEDGSGWEFTEDPGAVYEKTVAEKEQAAAEARAAALSADSANRAAQKAYDDHKAIIEKDVTDAQNAANTSKAWQELSKAWAEEMPTDTNKILPPDHYSSKFWAKALEEAYGDNVPWVTPEMFGAVGDGETDDTQAVKNALNYSIQNGKQLLIVNKYYVTDTILEGNGISDSDSTIEINIKGTQPMLGNIYSITKYGGIKFQNGTYLFKNVKLRGSIENVHFMPVSRTQSGAIFYSCKLAAFMFSRCQVSNIMAFFWNSSISSVTKIKDNRFLTVYYFAKKDENDVSDGRCTDSIITGNYINGGAELNDNICFEWHYFNGSIIAHNFIDYYRSIYEPKTVDGSKTAFQGPISLGNQYQVFRYLYVKTPSCSSVVFTSTGDCFNWTNPSKLAKLRAFIPLTYQGHDGNEHDIPPYIVQAKDTDLIVFTNMYLQSNCSSIVFIASTPTTYNHCRCDVSITNYDNSKPNEHDYWVSVADSIYQNGNFRINKINIPFIKDLDALPSLGSVWTPNYYSGMKVRVNNHIYRMCNEYNTETSAWQQKWVDITNTL